MESTLYINDYRGSVCDDDAIALCFKDRALSEKATVIFSGDDYIISKSVLIPSDTTVIVDGCKIKLADGSFDTVFRGDNLVLSDDSPYGLPIEVLPIKNIRLIGKNGAILSGPDKNPVMKNYMTGKEEEPIGDFWGWRTLTVSLSNCDNFEISGFSFEKARCWTLSFDRCKNGYIHDIHLDNDVKNGDGIDIRSGCHNCVIENITGYTGDDTVACTALAKEKAVLPSPSRVYPGEYYLYPMEPTSYRNAGSDNESNISGITIRNVNTGGKHHGVICLAANGCRIYNVNIENIKEDTAGMEHPWREATVKVYTGYGSNYTKGDIHDIKVSDITSVYSDHAFLSNADVENAVLEKICGNIKLEFPDGYEIR